MTTSRQVKGAATARGAYAASADARAAELAPTIADIRAAGVTSLRGIAAEMNRRGMPTLSGRGEWQGVQVRRVIARLAGGSAIMARATRRQAKAAATARKARTARAVARAADLASIIKTIRASGARSLRAIAAELNRRGIPTPTGAGEWHGPQVRRVLARFCAAGNTGRSRGQRHYNCR
jgi:hypothetical protein